MVNNQMPLTEENSVGKFILAGEHFVVYDKKAIAFPLKSKKFNLKIFESDKYNFKINGKDLSNEFSLVAAKAYNLCGLENNIGSKLSFIGSTSIPLGGGLGSSASICVNIIKSLYKYKTQHISNEEIAIKANELEKFFHGNPSGLDVSVISKETPIIFQKNSKASDLKINKSLSFVLIDTKKRSKTIDMVNVARQYIKENPSILSDYDQIFNLYTAAFKEEKYEDIPSLIKENNKLLNKIGVSSKESEFIRDELKNKFGIDSKITGAGGGGMMLGLIEDLSEKNINSLKNTFDDFFITKI